MPFKLFYFFKFQYSLNILNIICSLEKNLFLEVIPLILTYKCMHIVCLFIIRRLQLFYIFKDPQILWVHSRIVCAYVFQRNIIIKNLMGIKGSQKSLHIKAKFFTNGLMKSVACPSRRPLSGPCKHIGDFLWFYWFTMARTAANWVLIEQVERSSGGCWQIYDCAHDATQ